MAKLNLQKKKFIDEESLAQIVKIGISFGEKLNVLEQKCISPYDDSGDTNYVAGEYVTHDGYLWRVKVATSGAWNESRFEKIGDDLDLITKTGIEAMLGLNSEELDTLANLILDSEIRLDKTWSSSKIYESVQEAIRENKKFTLEEFAKANKASYHVVSATSEMTDKSVIYLMSNNTNYDMYIVESDGTPTKIGDVNIDLTQYAKLSDLDNYYDKATSDGKYATITTVDKKAEKTDLDNHINDTDIHITANERTTWNEKVDKTSIIDNLTSTDTDKPLSANQGKNLDDKKLNKADVNKFNLINLTDESLKEYIIENCTEGKVYYFLAEKCTDTPESDSYFFVIVEQVGKFTHKVKAKKLTRNTEYMCTYRSDNGEWSSWQRVCTTSVADVPLKRLKNSSDINSDADITYIVKNGICTVSANTVSSTKMSTGNITLTTGLPIPANTSCWYSLCTNSNATNAPVQNLLVRIDASGNLISYIGTNNSNYFGTFSYPVAES